MKTVKVITFFNHLLLHTLHSYLTVRFNTTGYVDSDEDNGNPNEIDEGGFVTEDEEEQDQPRKD